MDNGLTQAQAAEAIAHLAFYAGWPNVFSALPVAKEVFEKRPSDAGPGEELNGGHAVRGGLTMTTWTSDELHKIGAAAELELLTLP